MERRKASNRIRHPRQDPVSCQFCRSKKLKCDRQQPCSNCSARGVTCHAVAQGQRREANQQCPASENAEILVRLKRLEDTVACMRNPTMLSTQSTAEPSLLTPISRSSADDGHRETSEWLGSIVGSGYSNKTPEASHGISLDIETVNRRITETYIQTDGHASSQSSVWLPTKAEAVALLKYYMNNVHYLHPVLDAQTVRSILEAVYTDAGVRLYTNPAHVALLLSIFASAGYLWISHGNDVPQVFASPEAAIKASSVWSDATLNILDYSGQASYCPIEHIQATIIIANVIYNNKGFSATYRLLHCRTITMARNLSFHKVDSPSKKQMTSLQTSTTEDEIKRRIWWYIVSTDWLLAFSGGPQEGTYLIHPAQMRVKYPQDCGENIPVGNELANGLPPTATSTSFFLQRIRLSEICRTIVDAIPRFLDDIDIVDYEQIISLDAQFEDLIKTFPVFYRLDDESRLRSEETDHKHPQIATQRYIINLGVLNRRCKFHQPYLVRGFVDPKYAFSRDVCLRSARTALEVNRMLEKEKSNLGCAPARFGTVVHHIFMATMVLVMDLCFNKIEGCEEQRQAEVMSACRMLQESKQDSKLSKMFLDPLLDILQKHRALALTDRQSLFRTPAIPTSLHVAADNIAEVAKRNARQSSSGSLAAEIDLYTDSTNQIETTYIYGQQHETMQTYDQIGIDEMMQNYIDLGPSMDIPRWDDLFADLGSHQPMDIGGNDFYYG